MSQKEIVTIVKGDFKIGTVLFLSGTLKNNALCFDFDWPIH